MTFGPLSTTAYTANGVTFHMARLPPGRFIDGEGEARRELLVSCPFELGVAPVTQALWRAVMDSRPARFRAEDRPVELVSQDEVWAFLARLPPFGFTGFRLPTEVEWAWAARCGAATYWAGADRAKPVAVVDVKQTEVVAARRVDPSGFFDLSGNVLEWIADWYNRFPAPGVDSKGPESGSYRILRGGSWSTGPQNARVGNRSGNSPDVRSNRHGFRLFRTAP